MNRPRCRCIYWRDDEPCCLHRAQSMALTKADILRTVRNAQGVRRAKLRRIYGFLPRVRFLHGRYFAEISIAGDIKMSIAGATPELAYKALHYHAHGAFPEYF